MKIKVVGEKDLKEVDAPTIEDAFDKVKSQVNPQKVLEVSECKQTIYVKEIVGG